MQVSVSAGALNSVWPTSGRAIISGVAVGLSGSVAALLTTEQAEGLIHRHLRKLLELVGHSGCPGLVVSSCKCSSDEERRSESVEKHLDVRKFR